MRHAVGRASRRAAAAVPGKDECGPWRAVSCPRRSAAARVAACRTPVSAPLFSRCQPRSGSAGLGERASPVRVARQRSASSQRVEARIQHRQVVRRQKAASTVHAVGQLGPFADAPPPAARPIRSPAPARHRASARAPPIRAADRRARSRSRASRRNASCCACGQLHRIAKAGQLLQREQQAQQQDRDARARQPRLRPCALLVVRQRLGIASAQLEILAQLIVQIGVVGMLGASARRSRWSLRPCLPRIARRDSRRAAPPRPGAAAASAASGCSCTRPRSAHRAAARATASSPSTTAAAASAPNRLSTRITPTDDGGARRSSCKRRRCHRPATRRRRAPATSRHRRAAAPRCVRAAEVVAPGEVGHAGAGALRDARGVVVGAGVEHDHRVDVRAHAVQTALECSALRCARSSPGRAGPCAMVSRSRVPIAKSEQAPH